MAQSIFKRLEVKYLLSEQQHNELQKRIEPFMQVDEYGLSKISSIYLDTENYDIIRDSLEKPMYKEKLRLRAYGEVTPDSKVFVELKKKYDGVVYKRRIRLPLRDAKRLLFEGIYPEKDSQILREIDYFLKFYKPNKSTFISYDRVAMFGKEDENLRITFDTNIRVAFDRQDIVGGKEGSLVIPKDTYLMEIKANGAMPLWLTKALAELSIYPSSFSKYGRACKDYMEYGKCEPDIVSGTNDNDRKVALCINKFA